MHKEREGPRGARTIALPSNRPTVALIQTTIPDYRTELIAGLRDSVETLSVFTGESGFEPTIRLATTEEATLAKNVFMARRRLLWQRGCLSAALRADVTIAELNPRILSTWAILAIRRALGRPTLLWGHAWPRRGPEAATDTVRQLMRRLATGLVVYTDTQAQELAVRMPGKQIHSAPNGLYLRRHAVSNTGARPARSAIFVGRLVPTKKPLLLLEAFASVLERLPADARLVFVGDGDLRGELERQAKSKGIDQRVDFTGSVSEFGSLRALYWDALVSVSPGYVGLSLIQSLWFGVPMIIARDEPHAPEIEAAQIGTNAIFFESDSVEGLGAALIDAYEAREHWLSRASDIARACTERYAVESTVASLVDAIDKALR